MELLVTLFVMRFLLHGNNHDLCDPTMTDGRHAAAHNLFAMHPS